MSYQEVPWPIDEHGTGNCEREYLRNWKGMPPRHEWNASPMRTHDRICPSCGYKWQSCEFHDHRCWNCWMCETQPYQVRKFWDAVDRNNAPAPVKKGTPPNQVKIKRLGDLDGDE